MPAAARRQGLRAVAPGRRQGDGPGRADDRPATTTVRARGRRRRRRPASGSPSSPPAARKSPTSDPVALFELRERLMRRPTPPPPGRRRRLRRRRADRGHVASRDRPGDPLRGRRPARRPRRHPRRRRPPTATLADRHRLHRAQRAHLPDAAAALRRARRRDPGVRDVDVGARRRRPAWSRPARSAPRASSRPGATCRGPAYLRMLAEIPRFHRRARALLARPAEAAPTTTRRCATFLAAGGFTAYFTAALHGAAGRRGLVVRPATVALDYPARYLFAFLDHHGMLGVFGSPQWRTVTGGSRDVRRRGRRRARTRSALGTKVTSVLETADGVEVTDGNGAVTTYDAVVVATHPGQALGDARRADRRAARGARRDAVLRATPRCCTPTPRCCRAPRDARASWNFLRPPRRPRARSPSPTT